MRVSSTFLTLERDLDESLFESPKEVDPTLEVMKGIEAGSYAQAAKAEAEVKPSTAMSVFGTGLGIAKGFSPFYSQVENIIAGAVGSIAPGGPGSAGAAATEAGTSVGMGIAMGPVGWGVVIGQQISKMFSSDGMFGAARSKMWWEVPAPPSQGLFEQKAAMESQGWKPTYMSASEIAWRVGGGHTDPRIDPFVKGYSFGSPTFKPPARSMMKTLSAELSLYPDHPGWDEPIELEGFGDFFSKAFRYTGAAVVSPFVPAGTSRKLFGLSAQESKRFEIEAKVVRGVAATVAVVATGGALYGAYGGGAAAGAGAGAGGAGAGAGAGAGGFAAGGGSMFGRAALSTSRTVSMGPLLPAVTGNIGAGASGAGPGLLASISSMLSKAGEFAAVTSKVGGIVSTFYKTPDGQVIAESGTAEQGAGSPMANNSYGYTNYGQGPSGIAPIPAGSGMEMGSGESQYLQDALNEPPKVQQTSMVVPIALVGLGLVALVILKKKGAK